MSSCAAPLANQGKCAQINSILIKDDEEMKQIGGKIGRDAAGRRMTMREGVGGFLVVDYYASFNEDLKEQPEIKKKRCTVAADFLGSDDGKFRIRTAEHCLQVGRTKSMTLYLYEPGIGYTGIPLQESSVSIALQARQASRSLSPAARENFLKAFNSVSSETGVERCRELTFQYNQPHHSNYNIACFSLRDLATHYVAPEGNLSEVQEMVLLKSKMRYRDFFAKDLTNQVGILKYRSIAYDLLMDSRKRTAIVGFLKGVERCRKDFSTCEFKELDKLEDLYKRYLKPTIINYPNLVTFVNPLLESSAINRVVLEKAQPSSGKFAPDELTKEISLEEDGAKVGYGYFSRITTAIWSNAEKIAKRMPFIPPLSFTVISNFQKPLLQSHSKPLPKDWLRFLLVPSGLTYIDGLKRQKDSKLLEGDFRQNKPGILNFYQGPELDKWAIIIATHKERSYYHLNAGDSGSLLSISTVPVAALATINGDPTAGVVLHDLPSEPADQIASTVLASSRKSDDQAGEVSGKNMASQGRENLNCD